MRPAAAHETITIARSIEATADAVFDAFEDPVARSAWGPPSDDEAIEFLANDFRAGGTDIHRCGPKGDLRFRVETHYHAIDPPTRLLFTERVSSGGTLLSVSLVTVDIAEVRGTARLGLTIQIAALAGQEMIAGTRGGWTAAIANLEARIAATETSIDD